jgi:hypothetical protein
MDKLSLTGTQGVGGVRLQGISSPADITPERSVEARRPAVQLTTGAGEALASLEKHVLKDHPSPVEIRPGWLTVHWVM